MKLRNHPFSRITRRKTRPVQPTLPGKYGSWLWAILLLACVARAPAQNTWVGSVTNANLNWSYPANWSFSLTPTASDQVVFDNINPGAASGVVDNIVDQTFTVTSLSYKLASTNGFHTTQINPGLSLNLNGTGGNALIVFTEQAQNNESVYYRVLGAGTLTVTNTTGAINVAQVGAAADHYATLDLSGLTNFSASIDQFLVGVYASTTGMIRPMGIARLGATNFLQTAAGTTKPGIMVAAYPGSDTNVRGTQQLFLGEHNVISADVISMGGHKSTGQILSRPGITNGYALIRGSTGGTDKVKLMTVGDTRARLADLTGGGTSSGSSGTFNLSGTYLDLSVADLIIGRSQTNGNGTVTGVFTIDQGQVVADNLYLGYHPSPAAQGNGNAFNATGTLNLNGTSSVTVNNDLLLARKAGTNIPVANLNLASRATLALRGNVVNGGVGSITLSDSAVIDLRPAGDSTAGTVSAANLTGNGSITNAAGVTITNSVAPGALAAAGTLNVSSNLTLTTGAGLTFGLSSATTTGNGINDYLNIAGNLSLNNNVLTIWPMGLLGGTYRLIDYTGNKTGSLIVSNTTRYIIALDETVANQVDATVSGASETLTWKGSSTATNWDYRASTNWNNNSLSFLQGDAVVFDDTGASTNINLVGTLAPAQVTVNFSGTNFFTGSGRITGPAGIIKNGTGLLYVTNTGANDFGGTVNVNAGTLRTGRGDTLGSIAGATVIASGATLDVNGQNLGAEPIIVSGAGAGGVGAIYNSSAAQINATRFVTLAGDTTVGGIGRWDVRAAGTPATAALSTGGNSYNLTKVGPNQVSIVSAVVDQALGDIDVQSGIFSFEVNSSSLGDPTKTLTVASNASLQLWAITNWLDKKITLNGGSIVNGSGSNTVVSQVNVAQDSTLDTRSGTSLVLNEGISGSAGVTKINSGTLYLNGTNTYAGTTLLNSGRTVIGPVAQVASTNLVANAVLDVSGVAGGFSLGLGQTLSGIGGIVGDLTTAAGSTLAPGVSAGTLTFSNSLTLNNGAARFELSNDPGLVGGNANDLVVVQTNLSLTGINTIQIVPIATLSNGWPYTLFVYSNGLNGSEANLNVVSDSRYDFTVVPTATTPGFVQVNVAGSGSAANLVWQGGNAAGPNVWNTKSTTNWLNTGVPDVFYLGDNVLFDDTASTGSVTVSGTVQPAGIAVNNSSRGYTIGGSGSILAGGLQKTGPGTVSLEGTGANTFATGGAISAGTVRLVNPSVLFAQPLSLDGGSLVFEQNVPVVFNSVLADQGVTSGTVEKRGPNTVTLQANNTNFSGPIVISGGVLKAANAYALGNTNGTTTVMSGATLDVNGQSLYNPGEIVIASGTGVGMLGAIVNSGAAQNNAIRALVLAGHTTINGLTNRWDVRGPGGSGSFSGALRLNGFTLTKIGATQQSIVDSEAPDDGSIDIQGGILGITRCNVAGTGVINVRSNVLLLENYANGSLTKPIVVDGGILRCTGNSFTLGSPITNLSLLTLDTAVILSHQGGIYGTGPLVKTGSGTNVLSAADNTWAGSTLISAGTLQVGSLSGTDGSLPNLPITNNGALLFAGYNTTTNTRPISGAGAITVVDGPTVALGGPISINGTISQAGGTVYLSGSIGTNGAITQTGGTLHLTASNSYFGVTTLNGTTSARVIISNSDALGATNGNTTINGNITGNSTLQVDGNIASAESFALSARQQASLDTPHIESNSGTNILNGNVVGTTGGSEYNIQVNAGSKLVMGGVFTPPNTAGTRRLKLMGDGTGEWSGVISNSTDTLVAAVVNKKGAGTWTLSGTQTYRGDTTVESGTLALGPAGSISNTPNIEVRGAAFFDVSAVPGFVLGAAQTLRGDGSVIGNVTAAGTVSPGVNSLGTLAFSNSVAMAGTNFMDINRASGAFQSDLLVAQNLVLGGALVINNTGDPGADPFVVGDTFRIYTANTASGSFSNTILPPLDPTLRWDLSKLTLNGTISVVPGTVSAPTNLTWTVSGSTLTLSWPSDYIGWSLLVQTNSLPGGVSTNPIDWGIYPGSSTTNRVDITISPAKPTEFFRMLKP